MQWNIHHQYKTQTSDVCYGARNNQFGNFSLKYTGYLTSMILKHKSGFLKCSTDTYAASKFGCNNTGQASFNKNLNVLITNDKNEVMFPSAPRVNKFLGGKYYELPGYTGDMDTIVFVTDYVSRPKFMKKGHKLRIWYGEDLENFVEDDNSGRHCVEIVSNILQYFYKKS